MQQRTNAPHATTVEVLRESMQALTRHYEGLMQPPSGRFFSERQQAQYMEEGILFNWHGKTSSLDEISKECMALEAHPASEQSAVHHDFHRLCMAEINFDLKLARIYAGFTNGIHMHKAAYWSEKAVGVIGTQHFRPDNIFEQVIIRQVFDLKNMIDDRQMIEISAQMLRP